MKRSWAEISLSRLGHNLQQIRFLIGNHPAVIAVVKANAYGHGIARVVEELQAQGVGDYAVAHLAEAIQVRDCTSLSRVLVLGGCLPGEEEDFRRHRLTAALFDHRPLAADIPVEVEIDTGMGRLGIPWTEAASFLARLPNPLLGIYSHFASAESDPEFTRIQLERFRSVASVSKVRGHVCNSAALPVREAHLDAVRPGIALYGIAPAPGLDGLQPVLTWKTRVLTVSEMPAGSYVGYGRVLQLQRLSRIAVLPVGYADGYNRRLFDRGQVRIASRLYPVAGRISMDLTSIDVTDGPPVQPGDEAVLLEADPASPISAQGLGRLLDTISYEILTSIGSRVERLYVE